MTIAISRSFGGYQLSLACILQWCVLMAQPIYVYRPMVKADGTIDWEGRNYVLDMCNRARVPTHHLLFTTERVGLGSIVDYEQLYPKAVDINEIIPRTSPTLHGCIRLLGEDAAAEHCTLKLVDIPDDVKYTIENYDGRESVHEDHRIWS